MAERGRGWGRAWRKGLRGREPDVLIAIALAGVAAAVGNGPLAVLVFVVLAVIYSIGARWDDIRSLRVRTVAAGAFVLVVALGAYAGFVAGRRTEITQLRDANSRLRAADVADSILGFYEDRQSHGPKMDDPAWELYDRETARLYTARYAARAQTSLKELAPYVAPEDRQRLQAVEAETTGAAVNTSWCRTSARASATWPSACAAT